MSEEEKIEERPEDGKTESSQDVIGEWPIVNTEASAEINQSGNPSIRNKYGSTSSS